MEARTGRRWIVVVVTLLIAAPAIAAIVALAGRHWWPTDDFAIIDLRVRDVFTANSPLTGLYSRPGWNHPGPIMFWVMAPLSWVSGHAPWATRIGGAVMQAVALVWLGIATARHRLRLLLAAGVVVSFTYLASNHWLFREPWNLHIPLPYFVLFLFLMYLVSVGRFRHVIGMSVAGTVMVSTHISYAPLVFAGFTAAIAWTIVDARRAGRWPDRWRSTVIASVTVWAVTWLPSVLDVVLHWPGNLGRIVRYFGVSGHDSVGVHNAVRFFADEFRWVPPWIGGAHRIGRYTGFAQPASVLWLLVPAGLLCVAMIAIRQTHDRDDTRLVGLATFMAVVGIASIANADEPFAYTFQWRAAVASFLFVGSACALGTVLQARASRPTRSIAVTVAVGVVAWGSLAMTSAVVRRSTTTSVRSPELRTVMAAIDRSARPAGPVRVVALGSSLPSLFDGVVNELDRRHVDVRVGPPLGRVFGVGRTISDRTPARTWYVTEQGSLVAGLLRKPGARLLVSTSPLSPVDDRELSVLQERIGRALDRTGRSERRAFLDSSLVGFNLAGVPGIAPADVDRLGKLNQRVTRNGGCRCAIVEAPAVGRAGRNRYSPDVVAD